uniref:Inhibitor of growth protein n=1 Tax=Phytophthora ramorum TaxID=164328 RepID=H3G7E0_PHYRM
GTYVEDCLENMYMLPSELKRNFDLMRELDKTSYPLVEELKSEQKAYLVDARQKLIGSEERVAALHEKHSRVVQKLDEKIAIAAQSYDIVDHHIRRLDRDLESYATLLKANGEYQEDSRPQRKKQKVAATATVHQVHHTTQQSHVTPHVAHVRSKHNTVAAASGGLKTATPVAVPGPVLLASEDLPIDPNEPIYCSCRRVSFGQMVGCDNDDCKYEWFHFSCVGLTDQPAGKWYCQDC